MFLSSETARNGQVTWLAVVLISSGIIVTCNGLSVGPVKVIEPFKITPVIYDQVRALFEPGHIYGARQCGGSGTVLELKRANCFINQICERIVGEKDFFGGVFIPSENINDAVVRATVTTEDGKSSSVDIPMDGVSLVAGHPYQITTTSSAAPELKQKVYTSKVEIFSQSNYRARTCFEVDFFVRGNN